MKHNPSNLFLFASLVCFSWVAFLLWLRFTPTTLSFASLPNTQRPATNSQPTLLTIPSLEITLPVTPGNVTGNRWPVSYTGLIYVDSTPTPGSVGNSVIYGHNWASLLGPLKHATQGLEIHVTSGDGSTRTFIVDTIQTVSPDQTSLLNQTADARLTLYTCTGFLDTRRLVLSARAI